MAQPCSNGPTAVHFSRDHPLLADKEQKVISTGPYAIVRHPMYASALLYLAGTPLALGSFWGFLPFVAMIPFLI